MRPIEVRRSSIARSPHVEPPPPDPGGWGKDLIVGLTDRKGLGNGAGGNVQVKNGSGVLQTVDLVATGRIRAAVHDPTWRSMESTRNTKIWPTASAQMFANAAARGFKVRLRPQVGMNSPTWAFNLVVQDGLQGLWEPQGIGGTNPFNIPWVWDDLYLDATDSYFQWLSDTIGSHAQLAEVALTQPSTYYEEMFQWQMSDAGVPDPNNPGQWIRTPNRHKFIDTKLVNAARAYTKEKQLAAYMRCVETANTLFPGKSKNIIYNAFSGANADKTFYKPNGQSNPMYSVLAAAKATNEIHHMNHSGRIWTAGEYTNIYQGMTDTGQPISFQTLATGNSWWNANPTATLFSVCKWLVEEYPAIGLELPGDAGTYTSPEYATTTAQPADSGSRKKLTLAQMDWLNAKMESNAAPFLAA